MSNRRLKVQYFAFLREQRGQAQEEIVSQALTAKELYIELKEQYQFSLPVELLKVSINQSFQPLDTPLKDQDHIVFIPPVAGG